MKADFDYVAGPDHYWRFGAEGVDHGFQPGVLRSEEESFFPGFSNTDADTLDLPTMSAREYTVYVEDQWTPSGKWKANLGIRATAFQSGGHTRWRAEPRGQLWFQGGEKWRIKGAFTTMYQFLHLLTTSGIGLPNDLWVPATSRVRPQMSWQTVAGLEAKWWPGSELAFDLYFKKMNHLIAYQEGSNLSQLDARNWESKITNGSGKSYGLEIFLRQQLGRFSGWLTYTWSGSTRHFAEINLGKPYPFRYDRRHNIKLNGHFQINDHFRVAANWVYGTGIAITLPIGEYEFAVDPFLPIPATVYNEKNSIRMPDYHRLDIDLEYQINHSQRINLGVYNIYNRKNPVYYRIGRDHEDFSKKRYLRATLFQVLPYFSYKVEF